MKKAFLLTNKYVILMTPLILFALIGGLYLIFAMNVSRVINLLFLLVVLFAMTVVFLSGWSNMLKNAVSSEEDDEPYRLIKEFIPGVGEYFMPVAGATAIGIILSIIFVIISVLAGVKFIGNPDISLSELSSSMSSPAVFTAYLKTLSHSQLIKLEMWNLLILLTLSVSHFLLMFYMPAVYFKNKNPFKAFVQMLKDTFSRKFIKNLCLYVTIFLLNVAISILSNLMNSNPVGSFISVFINFYFVCFFAVWIFSYYYKNFVLPKSDI